ncbi:DUF2280 domain-containing protein [Rhizobium wenxiniae]|uniref:DUF2280 domain-containing protein n=1 Tax=Rhizobium wenxiniae TaxID=1737357 RepID=UPI003C230566
MAGKKLPDDAKTFIVQALACFDAPSIVAAAATKEFSTSIPRQQVEKYDPAKQVA